MDSTGSHETKDKNQQVLERNDTKTSMKLRDYVPIYIPAVEKGLLDQTHREKRFLDFLKARPSKDWFLKFGFVGRLSRFTFLKRNGSQSNGTSTSDPPLSSGGEGGGGRRRFRVKFVRKINWGALMRYFKKWIKHPMNMAFLIWLVFVAAGLLMLVLLMTGLLNQTITKSSDRKRWTEIVNQILNALFTIMCLYQHPNLFHHLVLLCRWKNRDMVEARKVYCKNQARRPHERAQIFFVVILLHMTCFSQYVLCALYWVYTSKTRSDLAVYLCDGVGILSPIIAGLYTVYSPLGRKYELETDEESQRELATDTKPDQNSVMNLNKRVVVTSPEWVGGLFDCNDDPTVSNVSFFCTFCVFGWNMERLGFGNMYVHIATFMLLIIAPLLVFSVSGLNIKDDTTQIAVWAIGTLLCFFGLFYGGFWRYQMRKKFKLPANTFCCGSPVVTDFLQWLFCWSCSLAQEVRTANFYEVEEGSFYRSETEEESRSAALVPLPREASVGQRGDGVSITMDEDLPVSREAQVMTPPLQPLIQLEDNQEAKI